MGQVSADGRALMGVLVLLVAVWGVLGWLDLPNTARAGFGTNGYDRVTSVDAGSPAQAAGMKPGDRIVMMDGIPIGEAERIAHQPRKRAGQSQRITVSEASGNLKSMRVMYRQISQRELDLKRIAVAVGFCFLLFPLAAFFTRPVEATRVLMVMGVGLSLAFMSGPAISDFAVRALTKAVTSLFVFAGIAATLQFLLVFPNRRPWLGRSYGKALLFLPAFLLWSLIAWRVVFTPSASHALNILTSTVTGLIIGVYLLISMFQFLRNFSRTDQAQRKALKLNGMLLGTILGVAPVTVAQLVSAFSPQSGLPGQDYYFITLALIPMTWARSASLSAWPNTAQVEPTRK